MDASYQHPRYEIPNPVRFRLREKARRILTWRYYRVPVQTPESLSVGIRHAWVVWVLGKLYIRPGEVFWCHGRYPAGGKLTRLWPRARD